jgi:hypothetical protein
MLDEDPKRGEGDLAEDLKCTAAKLETNYNGREIQKFIDAVQGERRRRHP